MMTKNGLNVPRIGEGGRPGTYKPANIKTKPKTAKGTGDTHAVG